MTVVLGGTAQFNCSPTLDGERTAVAWFIVPSNGGASITVITNQTVLNTHVFVVNEYRSILIFTNVSSELDGARVGCRYDNGVNIIVQPQQSRPTITVLCELFSPLILIDIRLSIMYEVFSPAYSTKSMNYL